MYDVDQLAYMEISDDVVDLLCKQIDNMPPECSQLIQVRTEGRGGGGYKMGGNLLTGRKKVERGRESSE